MTITGPETRCMQRMGGVDGMQALLNVLYVLRTETEVAIENKEGRLTWCEQREHFGFPSHDADPTLREVRRLQGR
jgi:hypothetical protein|nr:hypothetical protein [Rhodovarius lipocyclicus]